VAVRYVQVRSVVDQFSPVVRPTGNLVILGQATAGADNVPVQVASPSAAATAFGPPAGSALTRAIQLAFEQIPGPAQVFGIRAPEDPAAALTAAENLDVQFVVLANTVLNATTGAPAGPIGKLVAHAGQVSDVAGDGRERMAVVMLPKDDRNPAVLTGNLVSDRAVYIAHRSDQDAAAAVAGAVAGYPPHVSLVLKQVMITSPPFAFEHIDQLNNPETFGSGPAGRGVNWLTTPALLPGSGVFLGEGYTGNPAGKKFIDVTRTVDDIAFKLKARLIRSVGALRISRSGLRALVVQLESVLDPLRTDGVIEDFEIVVPILDLLDADPATLTPAQLQVIKNAQDTRVVEVLTSVDYAGAVHRIAINLKFV
jgi:hypothetical protein